MVILGIDPGLQKTGWGVIHHEGAALRYIASGLIKSTPDTPMTSRLAELHHGLCAIIKTHSPETTAMEETFVNKNPASALKLGQARGALLTVPALFDLECAEYSANKIKKSIVGTGHAAKNQMGMMIKTLLPASVQNGGTLTEDEVDALAVAITHAHYRNVRFPAPRRA